jgi:hypothetical protein
MVIIPISSSAHLGIGVPDLDIAEILSKVVD